MLDAARVLDGWRRAGRRITAPRRAILEALEGDVTHPSAAEILRRVRRAQPRLSCTTVYTTLEALVSEGVIAKLTGGDGRGRFDPNTGPHDHAVCDRCGRIRDVASPPRRARRVDGFAVARVHVEYRGLCRRCRR